MKNNIFLFVIILCIGYIEESAAQSKRTCGTEAYYQEQIKLNPQLKLNLDQAKLAAQQWLKNNPSAKKGVLRTIH